MRTLDEDSLARFERFLDLAAEATVLSDRSAGQDAALRKSARGRSQNS